MRDFKFYGLQFSYAMEEIFLEGEKEEEKIERIEKFNEKKN